MPSKKFSEKVLMERITDVPDENDDENGIDDTQREASDERGEAEQKYDNLEKISAIHQSIVVNINELWERMHVMTQLFHEVLHKRGELDDFLIAKLEEKEASDKPKVPLNEDRYESDDSDDDESFSNWLNIRC